MVRRIKKHYLLIVVNDLVKRQNDQYSHGKCYVNYIEKNCQMTLKLDRKSVV